VLWHWLQHGVLLSCLTLHCSKISVCRLNAALQYNVTVEGVSKTGERIRSDNWLPLVMPPGLLLTKAVATGNTTGAATARTLPAKTFIKVTSKAAGLVRRVTAHAAGSLLWQLRSIVDASDCMHVLWGCLLAIIQTPSITAYAPFYITAVRVHCRESQMLQATLPIADFHQHIAHCSVYWVGVWDKGALLKVWLCCRVHETAAGADIILLLCLQYNVTVSGVDKTGSITKGSNMLQFKTPTPALPMYDCPKNLSVLWHANAMWLHNAQHRFNTEPCVWFLLQ
jgi:hypothetical protein